MPPHRAQRVPEKQAGCERSGGKSTHVGTLGTLPPKKLPGSCDTLGSTSGNERRVTRSDARAPLSAWATPLRLHGVCHRAANRDASFQEPGRQQGCSLQSLDRVHACCCVGACLLLLLLLLAACPLERLGYSAAAPWGLPQGCLLPRARQAAGLLAAVA
jgi:hypothetical protein